MVRSYADQLERAGKIDRWTLASVRRLVNVAERFNDRGDGRAAKITLKAAARLLRRNYRYDELREAVLDLAYSLPRKRW